MEDRPYDKDRLKKLLHYIIWKAGGRADFGATKLYKAAWFSDARCFVLLGKSITGADYIRKEHGPIPRDGIKLRNELANEGIITQRQLTSYGMPWIFESLIRPDEGWFTQQEREHIDYWVRHISADHTARTISDQSHDVGWEIARMDERLPFYSVLANRVTEPNERQMAWAKKRARELNLP